jgi:hypothetical protein
MTAADCLQSQNYVTTDGQSPSLAWCQTPSWAKEHIFVTFRQFRVFFIWGTLSDERTCLSFIIAARKQQTRVYSVRVRVRVTLRLAVYRQFVCFWPRYINNLGTECIE